MILLGVAAYVTYTLNLWGPMMRMSNAASQQAIEMFKERLREFLESNETGRQAMAMSGRTNTTESIGLDNLDSQGKKAAPSGDDEDADDI